MPKHTDVELVVRLNDPRGTATEVIRVDLSDQTYTLDELDRIGDQIAEDAGWSLGYLKTVQKNTGGIGGDGLTLLSLVLGAVGAYPVIERLFFRLHQPVPEVADEREAWRAATWAVIRQYQNVGRLELEILEKERHEDHWVFVAFLRRTSDKFRVRVYGSSPGALASEVTWVAGDPQSAGPGIELPKALERTTD